MKAASLTLIASLLMVACCAGYADCFRLSATLTSAAIASVAYTCGTGGVPQCAITAAASIFLVILQGFTGHETTGTADSHAKREDNELAAQFVMKHISSNRIHKQGLDIAMLEGPGMYAEHPHGFTLRTEKTNNGSKKISATFTTLNKRQTEMATGFTAYYDDEQSSANPNTVHSHSESGAFDLGRKMVQHIADHPGVDHDIRILTDSGIEIEHGTFGPEGAL